VKTPVPPGINFKFRSQGLAVFRVKKMQMLEVNGELKGLARFHQAVGLQDRQKRRRVPFRGPGLRQGQMHMVHRSGSLHQVHCAPKRDGIGAGGSITWFFEVFGPQADNDFLVCKFK